MFIHRWDDYLKLLLKQRKPYIGRYLQCVAGYSGPITALSLDQYAFNAALLVAIHGVTANVTGDRVTPLYLRLTRLFVVS